MSALVRFVGDPRGYVVSDEAARGRRGWVEAKVGRTDRVAWINLSQAYLIEQTPETDD